MARGFIKNVLAMVVVLAIVFLSQQPNFGEYGKDLYDRAVSWGQPHWEKAYNLTYGFINKNIISKISGEVGKWKDNAEEELNQEKNKITENIWQRIKNYFANIF